MALKMTPGPFQRTKRSTTNIMLELFAVLCVVWIFAAVFHFVNIGAKNGISVLLIGIVSILVSCLCDVVVCPTADDMKYINITHFPIFPRKDENA